MRVRYAQNQLATSTSFPIHDRHRTLLQMLDRARPALHLEVSIIDSIGVHVVFTDYHPGDAPVLLINCSKSAILTFGQEGHP